MSTVNEKMTTIANTIRSKTGGNSTLSLDSMVTEINKLNMKSMVYAGDIEVDYTVKTIDLSAYPITTVDDIYLVATGFRIQNIKDTTLTESTVSLGTYNVSTKTLSSNKILSVKRDSITGDTGVAILCQVWLYI